MSEVPSDRQGLCWHATPAVHWERICADGFLRPFAPSASPRRQALGRVRPWGRRACAVHFALTRDTAFLTWHVAHGIPMVLLGFDEDIIDLPGAGLLPRSGRAWAHRDDFIPWTGAEARRRLADASPRERGRWELVVEGSVPLLPWLHEISFVGELARTNESDHAEGSAERPTPVLGSRIAA